MLQEFRQHYPQGSLVTEFVQVDREKYIVRALIQIDGITLLTSLAAANSVEAAEDKARERVLTLLNMTESPAREKTATTIDNTSLNNRTPTKIESPPLQEEIPTVKTLTPTITANKTPTKSELPPVAATVSSRQNTDPQTEEIVAPVEDSLPDLPSYQAADNGQQIDLFDAPTAVRSRETVETTKSKTVAKEPETKTSAAAVGTLEPPSSDTVDPMDLIVKTDIEMQRLGWTKEQGRDFLLQRYGKRSRHVLNERELREFFSYLTSQE